MGCCFPKTTFTKTWVLFSQNNLGGGVVLSSFFVYSDLFAGDTIRPLCAASCTTGSIDLSTWPPASFAWGMGLGVHV